MPKKQVAKLRSAKLKKKHTHKKKKGISFKLYHIENSKTCGESSVDPDEVAHNEPLYVACGSTLFCKPNKFCCGAFNVKPMVES